MLAEEDGEAALRGPQSTAGGGVSGGVRSRARRALGGEHGLESRRMALCPCGWREEHPGGTRGHGPHQGAKSAYNAPRGGGPGTLKIFASPPPRAYIILVPRVGWNIRARVPHLWNPAPMAPKAGSTIVEPGSYSS